MKINQVEELVGITKKNIRFYEDQGLLTPDRNPENGYREYSLKDVNELLKIKFMRKLSVPLEDIRKVQASEKTFKRCLEEQSERLEGNIRSLKAAYEFCEDVKNDELDYSDFKVEEYLEKMQKLEEGGQKFMDVSSIDIKKKQGAWIAALVFCLLIILLLVFLTVAMILDKGPYQMMLIFVVPGIAVMIGCLIALRQRLNEIKGGEENEARKY